jgi:hypothetical protein
MCEIAIEANGTWTILMPGAPPQTVEEAVAIRAAIRERIMNCPGLFALFGFRQPRKKRAPRSTDGLRSPTAQDDAEALECLDSGMTVYEAQEYFRDRGIGMTHNRMCQLGGARP